MYKCESFNFSMGTVSWYDFHLHFVNR